MRLSAPGKKLSISCPLAVSTRCRQWHPTPVLSSGKPHGRRSLVGCSPWGHEESDTTERLHFHFSLSCTGEGNGTPLQYSRLENPMDGGAWWAVVYGVTKSRTWLSNFTFTFHFDALEKEMATHSIVLAWRIPGMGEPGGLPSMGSHRVGHDWSDLAAAALSIKTPIGITPIGRLTRWCFFTEMLVWGCRGWQAAWTWVSVSPEMVGFPAPIR